MVDLKYVDLDLSEPPEDQGGGLLEYSGSDLMAAEAGIPQFSAAFPQWMVPRSEWKARAERTADQYRATTREIYSQGREGSCVGFGCCQALETLNTRQFGGREWVSLSGMSLYKRIGRSSGSGAYIPDGVKGIVDVGCLPVDSAENARDYKHTHPRTGFGNRLPSGWEATAGLFRATSWAKCNGADEVASALLCGFTGVVGRSRHCVPYTYLAYRNGGFYAAYANSWGGPDSNGNGGWGDQGFGYDSERTFGSLTFYVLLNSVTRPDLDIPVIN